MNTLFSFFIFELRRLLSIRNTIIILLLFLLSLAFLQYGVYEYQQVLIQKAKFQEVENTKISRYFSFRVYASYGFRILFTPHPISIFFFSSVTIPDMTSYINSSDQLTIYQPLKGKNIFDQKKSGFTDFSGFLLFFGTLLIIFYGYESFIKEDYLKFLATLASPGKVFISVLVSRTALMSIIILILTACSNLLLLINGIPMQLNPGILYFLITILLVNIFFLVLGSCISAVRSNIAGILTVIICWFLLLFFFPTAVNKYTALKSGQITPVYKLEMEKLKTVMDFEKYTIDKAGTFEHGKEVTDTDRELMQRYWDKEFKKIEALEDKMRDEMKENINFFQTLSIAFPTTFYQSVTNELSSRGYNNLVVFYKRVQDLKRKFVRFYMDKVYFSNFSKVESFVKNEKNVYNARPGLPVNFLWGILASLGWITLFILLSYYNFKKILYKEPDKTFPYPDQKPVKSEGPGYTVLRIHGIDITRRVYNLLSGKRSKKSMQGFTDKIYIDHKDIAQGPGKFDFAYICQPEDIPGDIKVNNLLNLVFRLFGFSKDKRSSYLEYFEISPYLKQTFGQLELDEKSRVLLAVLLMVKKDILVVNNLCRGVPEEVFAAFNKVMRELSSGGSKILYLTTQTVPEPLLKGQGFLDDTDVWRGRMQKYSGDPDD